MKNLLRITLLTMMAASFTTSISAQDKTKSASKAKAVPSAVKVKAKPQVKSGAVATKPQEDKTKSTAKPAAVQARPKAKPGTVATKSHKSRVKSSPEKETGGSKSVKHGKKVTKKKAPARPTKRDK